MHQGAGTFPGVWGETESISNNASGVRAISSAANGESHGLLARSESSDGAGVYAENMGHGSAIHAVGNAAGRANAALYVENTEQTQGVLGYLKSQGTWAALPIRGSLVTRHRNLPERLSCHRNFSSERHKRGEWRPLPLTATTTTGNALTI